MTPHNEAPFPRLRSAYLRAIARAWRDPEYVKALVGASKKTRGRGALQLLEEDYNFRFPFDVKLNIDLKVRPKWEPVGTTGWFGFADRFELWLPARPDRVEERASVLARYCAEFPTLLGQGEGGAEAPPDFAEVGVITSRLLALTWANDSFAKLLFELDDARGLLQDSMDCIVPWNFKLKFHLMAGQAFDTEAYWNDFRRSEITLHLPEQPEVEVQSIALAAYNATGGQYPFTCG